jgi:hypothetical protein
LGPFGAWLRPLALFEIAQLARASADAGQMSALSLAVVAFSLGTCLGASLILLVTPSTGLAAPGNAAPLAAHRQLPLRRWLVVAACSACTSAAAVFYLSAVR